MEPYFTDLATAFVRGRLGNPAATIDDGLKAGLRLHKFKRNTELPRVKRVSVSHRNTISDELQPLLGRCTITMQGATDVCALLDLNISAGDLAALLISL